MNHDGNARLLMMARPAVLRVDVRDDRVQAYPCWGREGATPRTPVGPLSAAQVAQADAIARLALRAELGELVAHGDANGMVYTRRQDDGRVV